MFIPLSVPREIVDPPMTPDAVYLYVVAVRHSRYVPATDTMEHIDLSSGHLAMSAERTAAAIKVLCDLGWMDPDAGTIKLAVEPGA